MNALFVQQTQIPRLSKPSSLEYLKPRDQKSASSTHTQGKAKTQTNYPLIGNIYSCKQKSIYGCHYNMYRKKERKRKIELFN